MPCCDAGQGRGEAPAEHLELPGGGLYVGPVCPKAPEGDRGDQASAQLAMGSEYKIDQGAGSS